MNDTQWLAHIKGPIVLAGAGKMGGAMLSGWLARGLDARAVAVIDPQPSAEISALAAKGVRLNPTPKETGAAATLGNVYEPYLTLTPHLDVFHDRLCAGFTFAEASYMSQRVLSWMTTSVALGARLVLPEVTTGIMVAT